MHDRRTFHNFTDINHKPFALRGDAVLLAEHDQQTIGCTRLATTIMGPNGPMTYICREGLKAVCDALKLAVLISDEGHPVGFNPEHICLVEKSKQTIGVYMLVSLLMTQKGPLFFNTRSERDVITQRFNEALRGEQMSIGASQDASAEPSRIALT